MTKKIGIKNPKPGRKIRQNRTFLLPGQFFCHFWSRYKNIYDNHNFCYNYLPEIFFLRKTKMTKKIEFENFTKFFFSKKNNVFWNFQSRFFLSFLVFSQKKFFLWLTISYCSTKKILKFMRSKIKKFNFFVIFRFQKHCSGLYRCSQIYYIFSCEMLSMLWWRKKVFQYKSRKNLSKKLIFFSKQNLEICNLSPLLNFASQSATMLLKTEYYKKIEFFYFWPHKLENFFGGTIWNC